MISLSSCLMASAKGDGNVVKQKRTLDREFDGVIVSQSISVYITYGGEFSLEVETDQNIQDKLITEVTSSGALKIYFDGSVGNVRTKNVYLTTSNIKYLKSSSSAMIKVENTIKTDRIKISSSSSSSIYVSLDVDSADISSSSSADITLEGRVNDLEISSSSSSDVYAMELKAKNCKASASSSADIDINVYGDLRASASSSGDIDYKGNPNVVKSNSSSGGSISDKS